MNTLRYDHGIRPVPDQAPLLISTDLPAVLARAAVLEGLPDLHQHAGRGWHAGRLSQLALELCCRDLGVGV